MIRPSSRSAKTLYFDPHFSGRGVLKDMLLNPMSTPGRAPLGDAVNASCKTCHDVTRGGTDHVTNPPSNAVSFGGGAYDVNSQQPINSAPLVRCTARIREE